MLTCDSRCAQPSEKAISGPNPNLHGYQIYASMPIKKGDPVVLGPQTKCPAGDLGWYSVRVEKGWTDDMGIWHKGAGAVMYDTFTPSQPHGFPLKLSHSPIMIAQMGLMMHTLLLPDGRALLDPDHPTAPPLPWRATAGVNPPPPEKMPLWYFIDHHNDGNLRIAKNLYKIAHEGGGFHRAIVFEAARDIQACEPFSFVYENPDPTWDDV